MFGNRLKELRISNGMSMDTLVERYNKKFGGKLNKSTISRYENGLQEPLYTVVNNFADLFDVTVDFLINENRTIFTNHDPDAEAFKIYKKLDTEDKAEIRGEMKHMLKADKYSATEDISTQFEIAAKGGTVMQSKKKQIKVPFEDNTDISKQFEIAAFGGGIVQSPDDDFETID